ncbi:hypothetical protein Q0Z83_089540 [Actinoplanes sichuanensis]|uniref:Uncharacterized protein n=1 Tax=Actinoplanes sichuanensis TaxID=512349 RepID=A0ABW4A462_9ACTN|nr:hypothetical protein [Actinoplanes sichuanensis]BEL10763.1 hypothetical protein Q0Z83_089540 [Actinoplanes sichuanensis]
MLTAYLEPIVTQGTATAAVVVGIPVVAKTVLAIWITKDADPKERAAILKAVAELFRWRRP